MSMRSREDMQVSYHGESRRTRGQPVLPGTKLTKAIDHPADKYSEYREQEERHDDRAISRSWLGQYLGSQLVIYSLPRAFRPHIEGVITTSRFRDLAGEVRYILKSSPCH